MAGTALGSVAGTSVTIMIVTGLWEPIPHPAAREQVRLFTIVTAPMVVICVSVHYLALFIAMLGGALGAALESHESVGEAAYTYQPDSRLNTADPPEPAPAPRWENRWLNERWRWPAWTEMRPMRTRPNRKQMLFLKALGQLLNCSVHLLDMRFLRGCPSQRTRPGRAPGPADRTGRHVEG